jgi:hypothetical protein
MTSAVNPVRNTRREVNLNAHLRYPERSPLFCKSGHWFILEKIARVLYAGAITTAGKCRIGNVSITIIYIICIPW